MVVFQVEYFKLEKGSLSNLLTEVCSLAFFYSKIHFEQMKKLYNILSTLFYSLKIMNIHSLRIQMYIG